MMVKYIAARIGKFGMPSAVRRMPVMSAAVFAALVFAASPSAGAQTKSAFETVPHDALVQLKATVGKPFTAGLVFVNGKFIPPPYKVERYGTALRINGQQVTGQHGKRRIRRAGTCRTSDRGGYFVLRRCLRRLRRSL